MQVRSDNRTVAIDVLARSVEVGNTTAYWMKRGFEPRIMKGVAAQLAFRRKKRLQADSREVLSHNYLAWQQPSHTIRGAVQRD